MGSALGYHVMMRLDDGRVIARGNAAYRLAASARLAQGEARGLVAFRIADSHIHALLIADRVVAGDFARYAPGSVSKRLGLTTAFAPARFEPVRSQAHLSNAFFYVLRQEERHGVTLDPMHDGSSLLDLLGMRVIAPWLRARAAEALPRVTRREVEALLGAPVNAAFDEATAPPSPTEARTAILRIDLLQDAAAAAFALPRLDARNALSVQARSAAVYVAREIATRSAIAAALEVSGTTVTRLHARAQVRDHIRAVTLQLRLRSLRAPQPELLQAG